MTQRTPQQQAALNALRRQVAAARLAPKLRKKRVFVSFDFDYDLSLKNLLVGQARHPGSPFEIADWSVKRFLTGDWQAQVRQKIRRVDLVIVICGHHTDRAPGVNAEIRIARAEGIPYVLLAGRTSGPNRKPPAARPSDKIYSWTWPNLKKLIRGAR